MSCDNFANLAERKEEKKKEKKKKKEETISDVKPPEWTRRAT